MAVWFGGAGGRDVALSHLALAALGGEVSHEQGEPGGFPFAGHPGESHDVDGLREAPEELKSLHTRGAAPTSKVQRDGHRADECMSVMEPHLGW